MKAANLSHFRKSMACPSSKLLLSYVSDNLSVEVSLLVKAHLAGCDFCEAELKLLSHHQATVKKSAKTPELPINLRILAESILSQNKKFGKKKSAEHGLLL